MNFYIILYAIFVAKFVAGAPYTDVNNDHRPVLDLIQPQDVENLVKIKAKKENIWKGQGDLTSACDYSSFRNSFIQNNNQT